MVVVVLGGSGVRGEEWEELVWEDEVEWVLGGDVPGPWDWRRAEGLEV